MYCHLCGNKMVEGALFCSSCGAKKQDEVIETNKTQTISIKDIDIENNNSDEELYFSKNNQMIFLFSLTAVAFGLLLFGFWTSK